MIQDQFGAQTDSSEPAIVAALQSTYGNLEEPSFEKIYARMESRVYQQIAEGFRFNNIKVTDRTDQNDDVSVQLVLDQAGDQVGLGLSGVGSFAALLHQDTNGGYAWVTGPDNAPTPLARVVATFVQRAGLKLMDRSTMTRTIKMNTYDRRSEVTLYEALFTDTDVIP